MVIESVFEVGLSASFEEQKLYQTLKVLGYGKKNSKCKHKAVFSTVHSLLFLSAFASNPYGIIIFVI